MACEKSALLNEDAIREGRCEIILGPVSDLPFDDDSLDVATAFETVYFWPDFVNDLKEKWDSEIGDHYYSIIDVIRILTESKNPNAYWRKLKQRLKDEGNETMTNCHDLKMPAKDGKMRLTDVANTKELLRLIQSIPSPKVEPLKLWLAEVGNERINEIEDPEIAISRRLKHIERKDTVRIGLLKG